MIELPVLTAVPEDDYRVAIQEEIEEECLLHTFWGGEKPDKPTIITSVLVNTNCIESIVTTQHSEYSFLNMQSGDEYFVAIPYNELKKRLTE